MSSTERSIYQVHGSLIDGFGSVSFYLQTLGESLPGKSLKILRSQPLMSPRNFYDMLSKVFVHHVVYCNPGGKLRDSLGLKGHKTPL